MQIAVWNTPFTRLVAYGLRAVWPDGVRDASAIEAEHALRSGDVDVALLPADVVLTAPGDFDVLPAVGVSTWSNPYVPLTLPGGLSQSDTHITYGPDGQLAALVARIVLKEHYAMVATASPRVDTSTELDSLALVGIGTDTSEAPVTLDLGQEWYELANYPMVWALFAMRKDESTAEAIRSIRDAVVALDEERREHVLGADAPEDVQEFELNELRLRLDDLALASLTELTEYLYFNERTDAIDPVPFASLPDDDA